MLDHIDHLLRHLLTTRIDELTSEVQVRFDPPDETWRTYVANLNVGGGPANALNVYLVDLRENRKLRSNERVRHHEHGFAHETAAPRRIDAHYFITAWSPAQPAAGVEPAFDEHALLYKAATALTRTEPLVPRQVYEPAALPMGFPPQLADADLPTTLLPADGFPKYAEFWGTMGQQHRWRPALWFIVTVPVLFDAQPSGPIVTTRLLDLGPFDAPAPAFHVGGHVLNAALVPPAPVGGAWVQLLTLANDVVQTTQANGLGRFSFDRLGAGDYRLRYQATGLGQKDRVVAIPSPTGEYDLHF